MKTPEEKLAEAIQYIKELLADRVEYGDEHDYAYSPKYGYRSLQEIENFANENTP